MRSAAHAEHRAVLSNRHHRHHGRHAAPPPGEPERQALWATLHFLAGCAVGKVLGLAIGTVLGWETFEIIARRDTFKAYGIAGSTLGLRLLESAASREAARLARVRFSAGDGTYLDVLEVERSDFASRRALAVARTHQRLAVVSIYNALAGGWEICAQANQDCGGADGTSNLRVAKQMTHRP